MTHTDEEIAARLDQLNDVIAQLAQELHRFTVTHQAELTAKYGAQVLLDFTPPRDDPRFP